VQRGETRCKWSAPHSSTLHRYTSKLPDAPAEHSPLRIMPLDAEDTHWRPHAISHNETCTDTCHFCTLCEGGHGFASHRSDHFFLFDAGLAAFAGALAMAALPF